MATAPTPIVSLKELLADPPLVHGPEGSNELVTHGLLPGALAWIELNVGPGTRSLETGSGLSTIIFAIGGGEHHCIVPSQPEVDRLISYCAAHQISTENIHFHVEPSERALPGLDTGPLDIVLIDGSHSFPQVFIDWFYIQSALKVGGTVVVDDVHVWTGRILRDFLIAEPEWEQTNHWWGRTVTFRKIAEVDTDKPWLDQPYVWQRSRSSVLRARIAWGMLREGELDEVRKRSLAFLRGRS
jgi:Methyltransferase domain